ncbi:expansin-B2 [Aegilops tauschii subsp. strangulata]|nr:expansin-B2 [Aegilops tauschii subsp. strangulata]
MAGVSTNAIALVALLSVLFTSVRSAVDYDTAVARSYNSGWLPAKATWYGAPNGAGPDDNGGACGFKIVNQYPISSMGACGNEPIFAGGEGCGMCYEIKCEYSNNPSCSGQPRRIVITDMNYYPVARYHLDLSGTAFGSMARYGLNDRLRHAGIIDMQFRRVPCNFPGMKVTFHVQRGSNPNYLAVLVEYVNVDGTVVRMELMQTINGRPTGYWQDMRRSWGSIWRMDTNRRLQGPFAIRITSDTGKTLVANNAIPAYWQPDHAYWSNLQFY